jgi:hypothetical protein
VGISSPRDTNFPHWKNTRKELPRFKRRAYARNVEVLLVFFPINPKLSYRRVGSIKRLGGGGAPHTNKKGTFDVNLVFTATLACTKRALFITKKGTYSPLKKRPCFLIIRTTTLEQSQTVQTFI